MEVSRGSWHTSLSGAEVAKFLSDAKKLDLVDKLYTTAGILNWLRKAKQNSDLQSKCSSAAKYQANQNNKFKEI